MASKASSSALQEPLTSSPDAANIWEEDLHKEDTREATERLSGVLAPLTEVLLASKNNADITDPPLRGTPDTSVHSEEPSQTDNNHLEEEDARLKKEITIYELYKEGKVTQRQLALEFGLNLKVINHIVNGKRRFDGSAKAGSSTALSLVAEVVLAHWIKKLYDEYKILIDRATLSNAAKALWCADNFTHDCPYTFGSRWLEGFNRRHPSLRITSHNVQAGDKQRDVTRCTVERGLQKVRWAIGKSQSKYVFVCDETAVHEKGAGFGRVAMTVGNIRMKHGSPQNMKHVTAMILSNLDASFLFVSFVIGTSSRPADGTQADLKCGTVHYNDTGSVTNDIWVLMMKEFVEAVEKHLGDPRSWPVQGKLLFDGFKSHLHKVAIDFLLENNITTIALSPNLTHLIQINDTGFLNGRVQQETRQYKANVASMNGGYDFPLERYIEDIEKIIIGRFRADTVMRAAKSVGFVYGPDAATVWMTQTSISTALDAMALQGSFRDDPKVDDLSIERLRADTYVQCLRAAEHAGIRHVRQGISERQLIALEQFENSLIQEHKSSDRPHRKQRIAYRPGPPQKLQQQQMATGSVPIVKATGSKPSTVKRRSSEEEDLRHERLKRLQQEFPGFDLGPYKLHIRRYMNGMNGLDWAISHVNQARQRQNIDPSSNPN